MTRHGVDTKHIASTLGVSKKSVYRWLTTHPDPPFAFLARQFLIERYEKPTEPSAVEQPRPEHLRREFQRTHSFTMIVQAMMNLEARSDTGDRDAAGRLRAIWDLMHSVRDVVAGLSGWTDEDWRTVVGIDYWRRLTRKKTESSIEEMINDLLRRER